MFSLTEKIQKIHFTYGSQELEISNEYKYLGIVLSKSGSFVAAKKNIAEQANKALFSLMRKIRTLKLPIDIQLEIFDKTIKPILLYGSEIRGLGNCKVIERVHLKFLAWAWLAKAKGHSCHTTKSTLAKTFTEKNE